MCFFCFKKNYSALKEEKTNSQCSAILPAKFVKSDHVSPKLVGKCGPNAERGPQRSGK